MSKQTEITEYFVFNKEWYELKKIVSKRVWDELFDLMLQLRFDGVDTDPQTITNKNVRSHWVMIRTRILNSMERCERKKEERKRKAETKDIPSNAEFDNESQISENKGIITTEHINPQPTEDCALEPAEIAKNEVCMQQFELDPIVDGEIDEDDCRYKEYMAGLTKDTVELSQRKSIPTEAEIANLLAQGYTEDEIMNKYRAA